MLRKDYLDRNVAGELGIRYSEVSSITRHFLCELRNALAADGTVYVDGLGRFDAKIEAAGGGAYRRGANTRIRVYFTKSATLKRQLETRHGLRRSVWKSLKRE